MPLLRKNDCMIMQEFIEAKVNENQLEILNIIVPVSERQLYQIFAQQKEDL